MARIAEVVCDVVRALEQQQHVARARALETAAEDPCCILWGAPVELRHDGSTVLANGRNDRQLEFRKARRRHAAIAFVVRPALVV